MKYIVFWCVFLISVQVFADDEPLMLTRKAMKEPINNFLWILEDTTQKMSLAEVLRAKNTARFQVNNLTSSIGMSQSSYWLKIQVQRNSTDKEYVLTLEDPSLTLVEIYVLDKQYKEVYHGRSGLSVPYGHRAMRALRATFRLPIDKSEPYHVFLKIRSNAFISIAVKIQTFETFQEEQFFSQFFLGMFYAIIIIATFYNLLTYFLGKEKLRMGFIASIIIFSLAAGTYDGMLIIYFPALYQVSSFAPEAYLVSLTLISIILFTHSFLRIPKSTHLSNVFYVLTGFYTTSFIVSIFNHEWGIYMIIALLPMYVVLVIWGYVWAYHHKAMMVKYLMFANACMLIGGSLSVFAMLGFIDSVFLNYYGIHVGYLGYILGISMGITDRLGEMRWEVAYKENQILKEKAKKEIEREKNTELEKIVYERTLTLTKQNDELVKLNAELDRFVYSISHELSSPLKSLIGLIELMRRDDSVDNKMIYLDMQEQSINKLDSYTRELTDLLRNARIDVQKNPIYFRELLNSVLNQRKSDIGYDKVKKIISIRQDMPFVSDKNRISVLLGNLISNSIQYHRKNTQSHLKIQVEVNEQKTLITISDNGQGIGKEHIQSVFHMFYRANEHSQGSGLGLYMVQETIEKLSGKIEMHSELDIGTIFKIEIPNLLEIEKNDIQENVSIR